MTNCNNEYPNQKIVEFEIDYIGKIFQTDSNVTYFEKHYRENLNPGNYTDYVDNGTIYYGGAGCGKTYKLCQLATEAEDLIILSFTNKATENVKSVLRKKYRNYELAMKCYTFDLYTSAIIMGEICQHWKVRPSLQTNTRWYLILG